MRFSDSLLPVIDKIGAAPRGVAPPRAMIRIQSAIQKTAQKKKKKFSLRVKNEPVLVDEVTSTDHDAKSYWS